MAITYIAGRAIVCLNTDTKPALEDGFRATESDTGRSFKRINGAWVRDDALSNDPDVAGHPAETGVSATHTHSLESLDAVGLATQGELDAHAAAPDPHTGYQTEAGHGGVSPAGHHTAFVQADHDGLPNPHHSNANDHAATNDPSADQKAALAGTSGVPSVTNKYVTDADARNTNARTPSSTLTHGDAAHNALTYEASGAVTTHAGAADPHTGYQKESEREAASGYAGLDASSKVIKEPASKATASGLASLDANSKLVQLRARADDGLGYVALANDTLPQAYATNSVTKLTVTAARTLTTTVPPAGCSATTIILTSGTTSFVITFGAGFKPTATLATGTTSGRVFVIQWISDGTNLYEASRTIAMVA